MTVYDVDIDRDEEGSETEEDYAAKIRNLDNEIQAALMEFSQQEQTQKAKNEYTRKRNALYSQRKYYRVKHSLASLSKKKRKLDDAKAELQSEHKKLKMLVAIAKDHVRSIESTASQPHCAVQAPHATHTSVVKTKSSSLPSLQRQSSVPESLPATSVVRDTRTYSYTSNAKFHPDSVHEVGASSSLSDMRMSGTLMTSVKQGRSLQPEPACSDITTEYAQCESHLQQHPSTTFSQVVRVPPQTLRQPVLMGQQRMMVRQPVMVDSNKFLQTNLPMRNIRLARNVPRMEVMGAPGNMNQPMSLPANTVLGQDGYLYQRVQSQPMRLPSNTVLARDAFLHQEQQDQSLTNLGHSHVHRLYPANERLSHSNELQEMRLSANTILGGDGFVQHQRDQSGQSSFGHINAHRLHPMSERLSHSSEIAVSPHQTFSYSYPCKSNLGGTEVLKIVSPPNPAIRNQTVPTRVNPDIIQRLDSVRRLQQTVFQELQELMTTQETF